jgi:hypothetical protein
VARTEVPRLFAVSRTASAAVSATYGRRGDENSLMSAGLVVAVGMALAFAFTNGVHDAANAIATLVATRAARPGTAVLLAAIGNVLGPLLLGSRRTR